MDKIVNNDGVKVYYRLKKGKGRVYVFLHGGGGSSSAWELFLPYFEDKDFPYILVDLRGHGLSDRPKKFEEYTLEKHAHDIQKILSVEKVDKVVLVGHCFGAKVATVFAATYPSRVEKLILINTGKTIPRILNNSFTLLLLRIIDRLLPLFSFTKNEEKRVDYKKFQGSADLSIRRVAADLRVMGVGVAGLQIRALWNWDGTNYFSRISAPTLVIGSLNDLLYPRKKTEEVHRLIKDAKIRFVNSNHISVINNPKEVYDTMMEFFSN